MQLKSVAQSRAERSIVDRAANLKQEIGTSSGPAHVLRLVHSPIDEKVCGSFCNRSSDTQTGKVSLGVVDEPHTLDDREVAFGAPFGALCIGAAHRAHPGSLTNLPNAFVGDAKCPSDGYQGTACANSFDDLLVALHRGLILRARRLDAGLSADAPNQTYRHSQFVADG